MDVRLAKYLAHMGVASRRKSEEIIAGGRVKVNGRIVIKQGFKIDPDNDRVEIDNKIVKEEKRVYVLLYKPRGYISSVSDPQGRPTVLDLLRDVHLRLYPIGRLDYDTEGLLLLTNDGDFANLMMHPRYEMKKKYQAWVHGAVKASDIKLLKQGIVLDDGKTSPALVSIVKREKDKTLLEIEIHEGRKRQVKRMCAGIGCPVLSLKRISFSFLNLKGLSPGQYRYLTPTEINKLMLIAKSG